MKVAQHLWFEKDMEAAVSLYVSLVPGSAIDWISAVPADNPSGPAGAVRTMAFRLGDQSYRAIQAGPLAAFNQSFSIVVECDTQVEIDRVWAALLAGGGKESRCGWLTDRWGLSWQIVPRRLGELMGDPAPGKARRVAEAMLKMVKFDIAALEAAADG
jgi:predicted 3-demethylubiquinone-9 3-methyltransferase (glyoxalase superfamily)